MFSFAVYLHIFRGLYYGSYKAPREITWIVGMLIYLAMMATAFMGYVLPWGQMSFWGATVITGLALQDALESLGCAVRLMTAIKMEPLAEPYIRRRARRHLEKNRIVILACGTGNPYVTTDTAAAQRALEIEAQVLLKATKVDGVYSEDPEKNPHAMLYSELTYSAVLEQKLRVMDPTAITQCMEHDMPILVFNYRKDGNIERAVQGDRLGTIISSRAVVKV